MSKSDIHAYLKIALNCVRKVFFITLSLVVVLFAIGLLINPDLTVAVTFIVFILTIPSLITLGMGAFLLWVFYRITGE